MPEIERRFIVDAIPDGWSDAEGVHIRQAYLTARDAPIEVRVRDADGTCTLTVKRGAGSVRHETEVPLAPPDFAALWELVPDAHLEKRRLRVPLAHDADALVAELDVYEGSLAPLKLVEVEFNSTEARDAFDPPSWFGAEVTDDPRYRNRSLADDGAPATDIESPRT